MKKILFVLTVVFLVSPCFSLRAGAYSDERTESIAEEAGVDGLENDFVTSDELSGDKNINVFEKTMMIISDAFSKNGISVMKSFGAVVGIILLTCVMNSMKFGGSEALDNVCAYVSVLVLSGVSYRILYNLFVYITASMESLSLAVSSLLPVTASLYVFGGSPAVSAASSSGLLMLLTVISTLCSKVLLPLLRISFALCLTGAIPGSINMSSVTNLVKNTSTTVMAFLFSLLGFALYLQTAVASASDTFVTRSVKFATGVFVPVIGNMLGDASRTVMASVSVLKGTVGVVGVVIILSAVLPPLIVVVLNKLMLLLCGITAKMLGCDRESALLYDLCGVLNVLLALVAGAGSVSIIALAVFIKTGVVG